MKIKELKGIYPKLYEEALSLQTNTSENPDFSSAFTWGDTPQGHEFWSNINVENFSQAKKIANEKGFLDLFNVTPDIPNLHYGGRIVDLPEEVVRAMLREQVAQGNSCNVYPFERNKSVDERNGGFTWSKSKEEHKFWSNVISERDYESFYAKYPVKEKLASTDISLNPPKFKKGDLVVPVDNPPLIGNHNYHKFIPYKVYKVGHAGKFEFKNVEYNCVAFNADSVLRYGGYIPEEIFRPATEVDIHNWEILSTISKDYKKGDKVIPAHISENDKFIILGDMHIETLVIELDKNNFIIKILQYVPGTNSIWEGSNRESEVFNQEGVFKWKYIYGNCKYNRTLYYHGKFARKFNEKTEVENTSTTLTLQECEQDDTVYLEPSVSSPVNSQFAFEENKILIKKEDTILFEAPYCKKDTIPIPKERFKRLKRKFKIN